MGSLMRYAVFLAILLVSFGCSTTGRVFQGEHYLKTQQWDLAVKEYREAVQRDPGNMTYRSGYELAVLEATNAHHKKGLDYLHNQRFPEAIEEFKNGLMSSPNHEGLQAAIRQAMARKEARERTATGKSLMDAGRFKDALKEYRKASELDPDYAEPRTLTEKVQRTLENEQSDDPLTLAANKPITLNFKNTNIREAFELLAKMAGINVLFDEEVKTQQITIFAKDVTFRQALKLLMSTNKLFMKKVSKDTIIIIPKNRAKIDQYQDLQIRTFYLNSMQAKDMVNILRTMLETKKILINDKANAIILRDSPEKIRLAEKIIEANDREDAELMLDVQILEISRNEIEKIGLKLGSTTPAVSSWIKDSVGTVGTTGITLSTLGHLSPESFLFVLPSVALDLLKTNTNTKTLASPKLRVIHRKPAKILIGQRVPIQISTTTTTAGTSSGTTSSNFEYRDVGIKLNVEPEVHINNEVTLKLGLEVSTLGDLKDFGGGSKQYIFGTRNADTTLHLRDGETTIIGGLIQDEERKTGNRIPGLSDAPVVGRLFAARDEELVNTDILMSITPHLVRRMELPSADAQTFWSGTDDTYDVNPVFIFDESEQPAQEEASPDVSGAAPSRAPAKTTRPPQTMPTPTLLPPPATAPQPVQPMQTPASQPPSASVPAPMATAPKTPAPPQPVQSPFAQPPVAPAPPKPATPPTEPRVSPPAPPAPATVPVIAPVPTPVPVPPQAQVPVQAAPIQPEATPAPAVEAARPLAVTAPSTATPAASDTQAATAPTSTPTSTPTSLSLPRLSFQPSDATVAVGSQIAVELTVNDVKNLYLSDITVTYDPEVLAFQNIMEGGFLRSDGRPTSFLFSANNKSGKVEITLNRVGNDSGVTGSGTMVALVFQGKKAGSSPISIKVNKLQNADRGRLDVKTVNTTLTVK